MRHLNHLPIWLDANRLLLTIEQAVRAFPRYHKYTLGTELRRQTRQVCRLIMRAADQRAEQARWLGQLVMAVDGLKLAVQLAKELEALRVSRNSRPSPNWRWRSVNSAGRWRYPGG